MHHSRRTLGFGAALLTLWMTAGPAAARVIDGVAAVVNEDVILVSEINEAMRPLIREYRERYAGAELRQKLRELQDTVVARAVEDKLILQVAARVGVEADKSQIDERLDSVIQRFGSEATFEAEIAKRGLTLREYRAQVRDQIVVQETVRQVIGSTIRVTDNEIADYYRTHLEELTLAPARRISTIFLPYPADLPASQRGSVGRRADQIRLLLNDGARFEEMAHKFSTDPHREQGGDIGFVTRGEVLPALEAAAFAANVGDPPTRVDTPAGIHLLIVTEERLGRTVPLSEARPRIQATLTEEKQNAKYEDWITTLKGQSYIDRKL